MKNKIILTVFIFLASIVASYGKSYAQTLPTYVYIGGGHAGDSIGEEITNNDTILNRLVVKQYTPARFTLLPPGQTKYVIGGSAGCTTGTGPCNIDEVWKTNSTVQPTLYTPGSVNIALVDDIGWVTERDANNNQCVFKYVLIDDDGTTAVKEGFYITPSTWTKTTLPSNLVYCPTNSLPSTNTSIPVHCSPGPSSTMVATGSFNVPRNGNMYIVSKESIGYASTVTCEPVPPPPADKTSFSGFLWGIEPAPSSCTIDATALQRSSCRLDELDLANNVTLRFQVNDGSNTTIATTQYDPNGSPPQYNMSNLLLDGEQVRICVVMNQMNHPIGGTYDLASAKIGGTSLGVVGNCTKYFTPPNPNGNNSVHLGFNYDPPASFEPPWYSTNNGDVFAGANIVDRDLASVSIASGFTNNIVTSGSGSVLGNSGVTPNDKYANSGSLFTSMVEGQTWGLGFPNFSVLPSGWLRSMPGGNTFQSSVYAVDYSEFNNWLNVSPAPSSYDVTGTSDLAVVYVHGNAGTQTINFSRPLTAIGSARLLIIADVPVTFTANASFGSSSISTTGSPNFQAAVVSTEGVTFIPQGGATPTKTDLSLMYQGLVATLNNNVIFGWDRGANNQYPATHVNFDPAYAWLLSDFDLNADTASGLTKFDLTWEVLD